MRPEQTDIPIYGKDRRVPGLRREEVALLAGVSVKYYTRLEQGEGHQVSGAVLEAIANALRLNDSDRRHLARLAWPCELTRRGSTGPEKVRDSLSALVETSTNKVAMIVGRHMDLLGANRIGYALLGAQPGQMVNLALLIFLDPGSRHLFADWEQEAFNYAAYLRVATAIQPDDPRLADLVGELSIGSHDFVRMWAAHPVAERAHTIHHYNHPLVGQLTLTEECLIVPDDPGQQVSFQCPVPETESADKLRQLESLVF